MIIITPNNILSDISWYLLSYSSPRLYYPFKTCEDGHRLNHFIHAWDAALPLCRCHNRICFLLLRKSKEPHPTTAPLEGPPAQSDPAGQTHRGRPEREMCPWAISKYFGDLVSKQVLKCKMVDKVQIKDKGMFLRLSTLFYGLMYCV
jgi:hypothetical protein